MQGLNYAKRAVASLLASRRKRASAKPPTFGVEMLEGRCLMSITASASIPTSGVEGTPVNLSVTWSTDHDSQDGGEASGQVNWGDGQTTGISGGSGTQTFDHVYMDDSSYPITVDLADNGYGGGYGDGYGGGYGDGYGSSFSDSGTAIIGEAAITTSYSSDFSYSPNQGWSGCLGEVVDANPYGSPGDFTGTINWGDGSTSAASFGYDAGSNAMTVNGSHTYTSGADYPVHVDVHEGSSTASLDLMAYGSLSRWINITDPANLPGNWQAGVSNITLNLMGSSFTSPPGSTSFSGSYTVNVWEEDRNDQMVAITASPCIATVKTLSGPGSGTMTATEISPIPVQFAPTMNETCTLTFTNVGWTSKFTLYEVDRGTGSIVAKGIVNITFV